MITPEVDATPARHDCPSYTVTYKRVFSGQHWTYRIRIQMINARGLSCRASHRLIQRFDAFIGRKAEHGGWNVGTYYPVRPWQCQAFRPYNGPHFLDNEDCKRRGGGRLVWQEEQLSSKRAS